MKLSDFCDEHGHVHTAARLTGVSVHFTGDGVPPPEQWAEMRARILISRRYTVVDETLPHLHDFRFQHSFVLIPGMGFEVSVDPEAKDLVRFEFEGVKLTPEECVNHFALTGEK